MYLKMFTIHLFPILQALIGASEQSADMLALIFNNLAERHYWENQRLTKNNAPKETEK